MEVSYRLAQPTDIPRMASLMNAQYARAHTPSYFQWQFFDSYYPTACITAWDQDHLVGMFGIQKRTLTDGTSIGHLIDLLIDPAYRGRGIFAKSFALAQEHFSELFIFSVLPNLNGKNACLKSLGMRNIAKIDDMVLTEDHFKDTLAQHENHSSPASLVGYATNELFRSWRYEKSPTYHYSAINLAITKIFKDPKSGDEFGDIVDWQSSPDVSTIESVCRRLLTQKQKNISTWALPHTQRYSYLRTLGFEHLPRERYFCILALRKDAEYLYNIQRWQLVPADAEIY